MKAQIPPSPLRALGARTPRSYGPAARLRRILPIIGLAVGIDQAAKGWAIRRLDPSLPQTFLDGALRLQLVHNPGIHLSLGAHWPPWLRFWLFCVAASSVAGALLFAALAAKHLSIAQRVGLSLSIGGLTGNVLDRFLHKGAVVDFINVNLLSLSTGVFNLADTEIIGGMLLLALAYVKRRFQPQILF
jgi:signal peptidase II